MQVIYPLGDGYPKPEELKIPELKDLKLRFRGSSNQRLIDMKKTRATGKVTIWEGVERL